MEKASKIFLKIGFIVALVLGIILVICGPVVLVVAFLPEVREALIAFYEENPTTYDYENIYPEDAALWAQILMSLSSFGFIITGALCIVSGVIAQKAGKEGTRGRYVACIIFGALTIQFILLGGIFGLVDSNQKLRRRL